MIIDSEWVGDFYFLIGVIVVNLNCGDLVYIWIYLIELFYGNIYSGSIYGCLLFNGWKLWFFVWKCMEII